MTNLAKNDNDKMFFQFEGNFGQIEVPGLKKHGSVRSQDMTLPVL